MQLSFCSKAVEFRTRFNWILIMFWMDPKIWIWCISTLYWLFSTLNLRNHAVFTVHCCCNWFHTLSTYCSRSELKKVTDVFSRMFHDPHGKVFSVFMETLVDLVMIHHEDLIDWLYILLTRLLNKTGADLLASVQAKVQRALEVVRWALSYDLSHCWICHLPALVVIGG